MTMLKADNEGQTHEVPYEAELLAFEHEGMEIRNPFLSDCGRFEVDPRYYGFVEVCTGGGCEALSKNLPEGGYLMLTDESGCCIPDISDSSSAAIGRYDGDSQMLAYANIKDIPLDADIEQAKGSEGDDPI